MTFDLNDIDIDEKCLECEYYNKWDKPHPYGSTIAYESLCECTCQKESDCPKIITLKEHNENIDES